MIDNASSNDVIIDKEKKRQVVLSGGKWGQVVCGNGFVYMRQYAHILNLIMQDNLKEIDVPVARVKNCVK